MRITLRPRFPGGAFLLSACAARVDALPDRHRLPQAKASPNARRALGEARKGALPVADAATAAVQRRRG